MIKLLYFCVCIYVKRKIGQAQSVILFREFQKYHDYPSKTQSIVALNTKRFYLCLIFTHTNAMNLVINTIAFINNHYIDMSVDKV
jgi:hypothetical protein